GRGMKGAGGANVVVGVVVVAVSVKIRNQQLRVTAANGSSWLTNGLYGATKRLFSVCSKTPAFRTYSDDEISEELYHGLDSLIDRYEFDLSFSCILTVFLELFPFWRTVFPV